MIHLRLNAQNRSMTLRKVSNAFQLQQVGRRGLIGPQGEDGTDGAQGVPGQGVPMGGVTGQVLSKASNADYDTNWTDVESDSSASYITVGKVGSGADFECDGTDDQVQIQAAIDQAVITGNISSVQIIGYGYDFQYVLSDAVILKAHEINSGLAMVNILGSNTVLKLADGYSGDGFRTDDFYNEIETNFNSYSKVGNGKISGIIVEGNSTTQVTKTLIYGSQGLFPATGVVGKVYVAQDQDSGFGVGYTWTGSSYSTTAIKNSGKAWRAYSNHLIKMYAYNYVIRDVSLRDASEFGLYSEQTNTDTNVFNNYATMESTLDRIRIIGWNLGGINWFGPHDSRWSDVKLHTNEYVGTGSGNTALYNVYVSQGPNNNGGGLVWDDFHPWGPTASYGTNVILRNTNVYGNAYIEGSSNQGLYATGSTLDLDLKITNNGQHNVRLNNCFDTSLRLHNVYQFTATKNLVKLEGTLTNSEISVHSVNTNNVGTGATVFETTGLTDTNVQLYAQIPYNANLTAGVTASSLSASSGILIYKSGSTGILSTTIRKLANGNDEVKNVRYFGAVGDDATDDTAAIQAAITAAGEGGIVYLPPGKYRTLSPIYLTRSVTLRGSQGLRWRYVITPNVYIKPRSTFSGLAAIIMQDKEQGGYATEQGGQRIENLNIDMSALTSGTVDGIRASGLIRDVSMQNVSVSYARGKGINTQAYTRVDTLNYYPRGWRLNTVIADTGFDNGFNFNLLTDSTLIDCLAVGNLASGYSFSGSGDNLVTSCRAVFNKNQGFLVTGSQYGTTSFVNCSTDRNEYNGMLINVSGTTAAKYPINLTNFNARRDGRNANAGGGNYAGLAISSAASPVIVDNLAVMQGVDDGGAGTSSPIYGVSATSSDLTITSGHIWGNTVAVYDGGTNTNLVISAAVQLATGTVSGTKTTVKAAGIETSGYVWTAQGAGKTPLWQAATGVTNLSTVLSSSSTVIASDTGNDATIPSVDATNAGVMTPTLKTKLDGIEVLADVTDAANVLAAGAVMTSGNQTIAGDKTFSGNTVIGGSSITDGQNVVIGTTAGTKIGTATTQKIGFFNATPVVQQGATTDIGTVLSNLGFRATGGNYSFATSGVAQTLGPVRSNSTTITGATTLNIASSTEYQLCNSASLFNVTLPAVAGAGYRYTIKNINTGVITVVGTIDGATNYLLATQYKYVTVISTNVSGIWYIVGNN